MMREIAWASGMASGHFAARASFKRVSLDLPGKTTASELRLAIGASNAMLSSGHELRKARRSELRSRKADCVLIRV